jgi:pre-mRNA cleavage complex 2 protein Pcf11
MQQILDDLQSDVQDELEKVSLERLSAIDPDLLTKIKTTAEESLRGGGAGDSGSGDQQQDEPDVLSFLIETRSPQVVERSKAWEKLDLSHLKDTHDLIASLQRLVIDGASAETRYTQPEAIEMTGALAAAASTATILTNALQKLKVENDDNGKSNGADPLNRAAASSSRGYLSVDKSLFTSKGVRKKNDSVIGVLYDVGLPFVSSSDGRRFATQMELSNHLDALFKKK